MLLELTSKILTLSDEQKNYLENKLLYLSDKTEHGVVQLEKKLLVKIKKIIEKQMTSFNAE